jgi:hypothetical protein
MSYEITLRQTTFWDFTGQTGVTRVHFVAKCEWELADRFVSSFEVVGDHPLLSNYTHPWSQIFTASASKDAGATLRHVDEEIRNQSKHWRSLRTYRTEDDVFSVLSSACGSLMAGPEPMIHGVSAVLESEGVRFNVLSSHAAPGLRQVLVADKNWVIAESFRIEELPINKPLKNEARKNARAS